MLSCVLLTCTMWRALCQAHLLKFVEAANARYSQVRGRKLAEASNAVNEMLLQASSAINSSMALEGIGAADFQSHVRGQLM